MAEKTWGRVKSVIKLRLFIHQNRVAPEIIKKTFDFPNALLYIRPYQYYLKQRTQKKEKRMNVDQHLKVAQWHIEQARLHATVEEGYKCGCPLNDEYQQAIDQVESGLIVDDDK